MVQSYYAVLLSECGYKKESKILKKRIFVIRDRENRMSQRELATQFKYRITQM